MIVTFVGFKGEVPRVHPRLLPESAAQVAINTRLENGALVPMNAPLEVLVLGADAQSIHRRSDGTWLSWPGIVQAQPGPVNALRTYVTGDGVPKVKGNIGLGQEYGLALNKPATALVAVPIGVASPATVRTVVFSYTYVTVLDEESQLASLSNEVQIDPVQSVTLSGYPTAGTIAALARGIDRIRFYRSQTDALGATNLLLVSEQVVGALGATFTFDPLTMPAGEVCPSIDYTPPVATLSGIISMPNGIMAAFSGKDLYFSEPFRPHAWPVKYSLTVDYDIVGLASIGSSVIVMTTGTPYVVQGTTPESMTQEKIEKNLPCVAARGIVDLGYAVAYPSTEGLVVISNNGTAELVTGKLFTRQQWAAINASTIVAGQHIGRYIFAYNPGAGAVVGIIDLTGENPFFIQSEEAFTSTFFELGTGKLFILVGARSIREWDNLASAKRSQTWKSRLTNLPSPTNFGCIMTETDDISGETFEVDIYADGVLKYTSTVRNQADRLPSGFVAYRWEVQFRGTSRVTSIRLAHSPSELN
jgi:hypothetical protein